MMSVIVFSHMMSSLLDLQVRKNYIVNRPTQAEGRRGAMAETQHGQRVFSLEVQPGFELRPQRTHFDGLVDERGANIQRGRLQGEALARARL